MLLDKVVMQYPQSEPDDGDLVRSARAELKSHVEIAEEDIDLEIDGGVVRLSGFVPDREQRAEAVLAVEHVPGVRSVTNELKLVALQISPRTLHLAVEAALVRHAAREAEQLAFEIHGSTVTVAGEVASEAVRAVVLAAVTATRGVDDVVDRMRSRG